MPLALADRIYCGYDELRDSLLGDQIGQTAARIKRTRRPMKVVARSAHHPTHRNAGSLAVAPRKKPHLGGSGSRSRQVPSGKFVLLAMPSRLAVSIR